jgi:hypothetical protein
MFRYTALRDAAGQRPDVTSHTATAGALRLHAQWLRAAASQSLLLQYITMLIIISCIDIMTAIAVAVALATTLEQAQFTLLQPLARRGCRTLRANTRQNRLILCRTYRSRSS